MNEFFRFPHTPHLEWLGPDSPRDDKVLDAHERDELLSDFVVVEEKIDGANVGISVADDGSIIPQNRGELLIESIAHPQFGPLWAWLDARKDPLIDELWPHCILFGEWCYATHSVRYDRLPDWFVGFDLYDRREQAFWSTKRRDALLSRVGVATVPRLAEGRFSLDELRSMFGTSHFGAEDMEGIVIRRDDHVRSLRRAKLVRPTFVQDIEEHWSRQPLRRNAIEGAHWSQYDRNS